MRKQLKLFTILLTIVFGIFNLSNITLFPAVRATYVEGPITQDTIWTLVDSPFVVSNDVFVYSNATLTIEPGVEVKFGANFSLIVEGTLVANGISDKMIRFTSNKDEPEAGDWGTIRFNGTHSSSLEYCIAEYGTSGITVENGSVTIQKNKVIINSENGIMITDGNVMVKNNEIANNTMGGVYIAGNSHVIVQNNIIRSNNDGIILAANSTSEININQNEIFLNTHSGMLCESGTDGNTYILYNKLSENSYGFCVSTNTSTYITRNYILNNTIGIFYEEGKGHTAHFNDIWGNDLGMDVSSDVEVNATYNYWGDRSGPYHKSLNPRGRGNPVGGNGANLNFIFFLTAPIYSENVQPTAILWTDKTLVAPNQCVTFIGTDSYDNGRVDQYFFDFGDGKNSNWTTLTLFNHSYSATGSYVASLGVIDDFGVASDRAFATISVQDLTPLEAFITLSNYTVNYNEEVLVTVYVSNGIMALENASVTLFSVKGGSFTPQSGLTNSTGYFTATFTAPNVTETTNVRIIARASKTDYTGDYADGSDYGYLKVLPPLLVQVTAEPMSVESEETATLTVHVKNAYEEPVADASLILSSDNGSLSATTGITDLNGTATFNFTSPQTLAQINVTILATAMKTDYAEGHGQAIIAVEPKQLGTLSVEVLADPSTVMSRESALVTVHVTCNATPVADASITISSTHGNLSQATGVTDSNGYCTFVFTAPRTTEQLPSTVITVNAAKNGYISGQNQTTITVTPETGGGWPLTTILLILIPIVVVAIVVVLIKLKIIVLSVEEEEEK